MDGAGAAEKRWRNTKNGAIWGMVSGILLALEILKNGRPGITLEAMLCISLIFVVIFLKSSEQGFVFWPLTSYACGGALGVLAVYIVNSLWFLPALYGAITTVILFGGMGQALGRFLLKADIKQKLENDDDPLEGIFMWAYGLYEASWEKQLAAVAILAAFASALWFVGALSTAWRTSSLIAFFILLINSCCQAVSAEDKIDQ